jgi:predicted nucleic acid-binding protein
MKLVIDTNVVVSTILGRSDPVARVIARGVPLFLPEAQLGEAVKVIVRIAEVTVATARDVVALATDRIQYVEMADLAGVEGSARARLGGRGQPDWPVLATAMLLDAHIWSEDRDFFGVGVGVWSTRNIDFASPKGNMNG